MSGVNVYCCSGKCEILSDVLSSSWKVGEEEEEEEFCIEAQECEQLFPQVFPASSRPQEEGKESSSSLSSLSSSSHVLLAYSEPSSTFLLSPLLLFLSVAGESRISIC